MKASVFARRLALSVAARRLGLTVQVVSRLPKSSAVADYLAISDLITRVMTWGRVVDDSVITQDDINRGLVKALNDDLALEELVSLGYAMQQGDAVAVADAVNVIVAFQRNVTELVLPQDSLIRTVGKELADTLLASEAPLLSLAKAATDAVSGDDALVLAFGKTFGETATASDIVNLIASYPRNFTETLSASDTLGGWSMYRELSDTAYQGDTASWSVTKALTDAASLDDAVSLTTSFVRFITDSVLTIDSTSYFMGGSEVQTPSDETATDDALVLDTLKELAETASALDTLLLSMGWNVGAADVVDAVVDELVLAITQRFYETVLVDDAITSVDTEKGLDDVAAAVALNPDKSLETLYDDTLDEPIDGPITLEAGKNLTDSASSDEASSFDLTALLEQPVNVADSPALQTELPQTDDASTTDDWLYHLDLTSADEALAGDEALLDFTQTLADLLAEPTSEATLSAEPNLSESAVASAEGTWRMQDYVDPTYLAEDYVGSTGSF